MTILQHCSKQPHSHYEVYVFDDFLSAVECNHLIETARNEHLWVSRVIRDGGKTIDKTSRDSHQVFLPRQKHEIADRLLARMNGVVRMSADLAEELMVARYKKNGFFVPHFDFNLEKKGIADRLATFMVYLNDVTEGGETEFPNLGVRIVPKRGRALLWYSYSPMTLPKMADGSTRVRIPMNLAADPCSLHAGLPVKKGEKWIATQWFSFKQQRGRVRKKI